MTDPVSPGQPGQPGQPYGGYLPPPPQGGYPQQDGYPPQPPQGGYQPGSDPYGSHPQGGEAPAPNPYDAPAPNAYGAPNPYGAPVPNSYDAPAPNAYGAPNPYGAPVPPPVVPKKGGAGKVIGIVVGVLVLVGLLCVGGIFAVTQLTKSDASNAKVSDCLAGDSMDSTAAKPVKNVKIVSCTSSDAKYKVVGVVDGKTEVDFNIDEHICDAYPTAKSALWQGQSGRKGSVLCLESAR